MVSFVDSPASLINSDWHFLYIITYCNLCKLYTVQLVLVMAMLAKWGDKSNTFAMYVIYVRVKKLLLFRGTTGNALKILFKKVLFFDYHTSIIDEDSSRKGMECRL